jgi:pimeloyl-ACP methyl ester carboxylesterase
MVLLHNGGTSRAIWRPVVEELSESFETFAIDLLGYGESAKPGSGYSLERHVAVLAALVDKYCAGPVVLVGNCMGSAISLKFAMERPQSVRALVLVNPLTEATFGAGMFGPMLRLRQRLPTVGRGVFAGLRKVPMAALGTGPLGVAVTMQTSSKSAALEPEDDQALRACYADPGQMTSLLAVLDDISSYGLPDTLEPGRVVPPICTIWGLDNKVLSPKEGRKLNRKLGPDREEWLADCGHLPMLERPSAVSEAILGFLEEVPEAVPETVPEIGTEDVTTEVAS